LAATCRRTGSQIAAGKRCASQRDADCLVLRVRGPVGEVLGDLREQVSDVVQQRREPSGAVRATLLREVRALQGVLVIETRSPK